MEKELLDPKHSPCDTLCLVSGNIIFIVIIVFVISILIHFG